MFAFGARGDKDQQMFSYPRIYPRISDSSLCVVNFAVQKFLKTPVPSPSLTAFVKGQRWQLSDTRLVQIGHVGRLLVHHRTIVPTLKRSMSRESLSSVKDLQKMLAANNAVLVEN